MKLWKILLFLILLIGFNLTYLSNSGLLVFGLKNARSITYKNAHKHAEDDSKIPSFRMDSFLTTEECEDIIRTVYALQQHWEQRNVAMFTLGTASYLDGFNKQEYVEKSMKSNVMMRQHFQPLLDKVLLYFKSKTTSTVVFRDNAALPGFHVFDCNKIFSMPVASVHRDMQWQMLTYKKGEDIDMQNMLSFTLAIELPPGGGGLYTFEQQVSPLVTLFIPRGIVSSFAPKTKIEYKQGFMVTHNGQMDHMIAPCEMSRNKKRITLQGHGVYEKNSDTWFLYW
jgi:hypothetical protein